MPDRNIAARAHAAKARALQKTQTPAHKSKPEATNGSSKMKLDDGTKKQQKKKNKGGIGEKLKAIAKIDKLPKNVRDSVPFRGITREGIIETSPGTYTKCYHLEDANFQIATTEEQSLMFSGYMDLLNTFDANVRWEVTIFNHKIDKVQTIKDLRILPQPDGLNKYRNEMNQIILGNLSKGNNSITQDKYLTVSIQDESDEHAASVLSRLDTEVDNRVKKISGKKTKPMTTQERLKLFYDIYNQDEDYRLYGGVFDGDSINLDEVARQGLSVKDIIAPAEGMEFNGNDFKFGDTYGTVLYLQKVPTMLSTNFIAELTEIASTMLISVYYEPVENEKAVKLVRSQMASIEAQGDKLQRRNAQEGLFVDLPPELLAKQASARDLMSDITTRNQRLFFMTMTVAVFADSKEQLEANLALVKSVAANHQAPLRVLQFQQEFGVKTVLPLARNDLFVEKMCTTESAAVFIPYYQETLSQKNAIFYGLSGSTNTMVLYNRLTGDNYNGLVFGSSGSGKSFTAKCEMINVLLNHKDAQVFVIDPQGEYGPLADALHGQRIDLYPGSGQFINPLDLDLSDDETDPLTMKSDFVVSMLEIMLGKGRELQPACKSIIDRCISRIYEPYLKVMKSRTDGVTLDKELCPSLTDLYQELRNPREDGMAQELADILDSYTVGNFNTFARRSTVETNRKFVIYNIKRLGSGMQSLGLHICIQDVWNRMMANAKRHIYTWFYIDEFHILLEKANTRVYLKQIWKMARKWMGVPTGIMQNTEDLYRSSDGRAILNNTSFVIMLKSSPIDRQNLAELFSLSAMQLEYINETAQKGHGLLYTGSVTIPFGLDFPKDTELFKIMSTSPAENMTGNRTS